VQAILAAHNLSGERLIRYAHYLKGSVFCGRCGSRLSVCNFKGNGGSYMYFFCLGRHRRNGCDLPYLDVDQLEELVANHWRTKQLPAELVETIRSNLTADLNQERIGATKLIDAARRKVEKIKRDRVVWATKSADGVIPDDIGRSKQNELTQQLVRADHDLAKLEQATEDITGVIHAALDLIRDCGQAYAAAGPMMRRDWNQTFFAGVDVDVDRVTKSTLKAPFDTLMDPATIAHYERPTPVHHTPNTKKDPRRGPSRSS
jgi:site-specific DNA recombinase